MFKYIILVVIGVFGSSLSLAQIEAVTKSGNAVLLYDDGTWRSADELKIETKAFVFAPPSFSGNIGEGSNSVSHKLAVSSSSPNSITDDEKWFRENDLSLPIYSVPNSFRGIKGEVPIGTPLSYNGEMLVRAIYSEQYNFFVYGRNFSEGRYLLITDKEVSKVLHLLDFENYVMSPDYVEADRMFIDQSIGWVEIEGSTLYISHGHRTYAKSSKGMNAYITAIDLSTYDVLWRTKPLVCNTRNFVLYDDMIVCGYGFTAEKDYMFVLNKKTGAVAQKLMIKSGPDFVIRKNNVLHVRTYNTDYIFKVD